MSEIFLEEVRLVMNAVVLILGYTEFCRVTACEHICIKKDYEIIFIFRKAVEVWNKLYSTTSVFSCLVVKSQNYGTHTCSLCMFNMCNLRLVVKLPKR
jgi:hypothetical protein